MIAASLKTRIFNIHIPNLNGDGIAEIIPIRVQVCLDPDSGEEVLTPESLELIEMTKTRHLGLLTANQIRALRERLGLTKNKSPNGSHFVKSLPESGPGGLADFGRLI